MKASAGKRILMLLENNPYPQDVRVRAEARALADAGYHLSVIAPRGSGQPWHEVIDGVHAYRYPAPAEGASLLAYAWEYGYSLVATFLLSIIVFFKEGFDVIHAHNPPDTFVLVAAIYKLLGKRFVFDHHDLSPEMYYYARFSSGKGNWVVYQLLLWFEKLTFKLSDHVIATNESYKKIAMERGGVPAEQITIVRNGPDLNRLYLVPVDPELRGKAKALFGYVGVMSIQDGLDYLLRALKHLITNLNRTDFYCVIIGNGSALPYYKEVCTKLDLDQHVRFTGRVPKEDLLRYLSTVDICVDPDPSNPFNDRCTMIKMMEYMTMKKPIVAFDLPEHRVTAQSAAIYVSPNDELEFARALVQLMDDPQRRQEMGAFGRQRIETSLAWSHSVSNLLACYRTLFREPVSERVSRERTGI